MFAFALADTATGELVLARDPLGIKPLFYLRRGDGVVFASELKALLAAIGQELGSSQARWWPRCCTTGSRAAVRDQGRAQAPRRELARFRPDGTHEVQAYWRVQDVARDAATGPAADLRSVVEESVAAHLVADVPVSSFLSGGLDSSIITVLAHRAASDVDAYTITFRPEDQKLEAMPDDAVYARKVAAKYGIKLHEIEISPDIVSLLPRMVDILDGSRRSGTRPTRPSRPEPGCPASRGWPRSPAALVIGALILFMLPGFLGVGGGTTASSASPTPGASERLPAIRRSRPSARPRRNRPTRSRRATRSTRSPRSSA